MSQWKLSKEQHDNVRKIASLLSQQSLSFPFACHSVDDQAILSRSLQIIAAVAKHGTTDGKIYVEPQPQIPEGYRKAVAGDEGRADAKKYKDGHYFDRWLTKANAVPTPFVEGEFYIVPKDIEPQAKHADSFSKVMVRDALSQKWKPAFLVAINQYEPYRFQALNEKRSNVGRWIFCRLPYPGE